MAAAGKENDDCDGKPDIPESEISQRTEPADALRSLAVHPDRGDLACGDRSGNVFIFSFIRSGFKIFIRNFTKG